MLFRFKQIINKDKIDNAFHYFDVYNNGVIDVII